MMRTLAFVKWHEQRWRKFVMENICLMPLNLDEAGLLKLEGTTKPTQGPDNGRVECLWYLR